VKITALGFGADVLQLTTDQGLRGIACIAAEARPQAEALAKAMLIGQDPRGASGLWQRMVDACCVDGACGLALRALSALDIAVWDLKSKAKDEPLWRTLGGSASPLNSHFRFAPASPNLEHASAAGFRSGKLVLGDNLADDLATLGHIRETLRANTDAPSLMLDANERWSPKEAIRAMREIEESFDITWIEEPAKRWDFLGLKRVADSIRAAVCSSERLSVVQDYLPHFHHGSANIVQIDLNYGGITGAMQLADAAFGFELPVVLSAISGNIHAHVAAAIPYCMSVEIAQDGLSDEVGSSVRVEDGWVHVGEAVGHGLRASGASA
jgi:L-alanine-DL-glutamate epimerase-like enolase superfamily enzyme